LRLQAARRLALFVGFKSANRRRLSSPTVFSFFFLISGQSDFVGYVVEAERRDTGHLDVDFVQSIEL